MANIIQNQVQKAAAVKPAAQQSVGVMLSSLLDSNKMRGRFDELLGKRAPQFISALTTLITGTPQLQQAFLDSPMTVITSALKAASFDLPIEPALGYAYIIPFKKNSKDANGNWSSKYEAQFILGYKGLEQLCLRTGCYSRVPDAVDVREGELVRYDRLTGDAEFEWVEDEEQREKLPVIGYAGYFRLKNGAEKTIYMSVSQIKAHEQKNRKGREMSPTWRDDFDSMARKTIIRRLVTRYGLMSIDYHNADEKTVSLAQGILEEPEMDMVVDAETGEVVEGGAETAGA